jgi:hypothetical protein
MENSAVKESRHCAAGFVLFAPPRALSGVQFKPLSPLQNL